MTKLSNEDLKNVSGGATNDIQVDSIIYSNTGMNCAELLQASQTLLAYAREDGKTYAADLLENTLQSGTLNVSKIMVLLSALADLKAVAQAHNLTKELELLNMISFF